MNFNDIDDYASYYASQLILQYKCKPKAYAHIKAKARAMFVNFSEMGKWRSLDDASGDALLALAELFGVSVWFDGVNYTLKYFATEKYSQQGYLTTAQEGFQTYEQYKEGYFFQYSDHRSRSLFDHVSDYELKGLIRIKALNTVNMLGSKKLQELLDVYYNGVFVSETYSPPTLIYNMPDDSNPNRQRYITIFTIYLHAGYLPKPPGVTVALNLPPSPPPNQSGG